MVQPRTKYQPQMDPIRVKGLQTVHVFHVCKNITEGKVFESKKNREGKVHNTNQNLGVGFMLSDLNNYLPTEQKDHFLPS